MEELKKILPIFFVAVVAFSINANCAEDKARKDNMKYALTELKYPTNALEPYIDASTVEIHHGKHQATYVNNLNNILASAVDFKFDGSLQDLLSDLSKVPDSIRNAIRNNGGGVWNHEFYWEGLSPEKSMPSDELLSAIKESFGTFENFQKLMVEAALSRFGSGWTWLGVQLDGKLAICSTPNQDSPIMGKAISNCDMIPILCIDVWEHAYYLKYQNKRADYLNSIWNIIDWNVVNKRFDCAKK